MSQYVATPARFPEGVSTSPRRTLFGRYPRPSPVRCTYYENDFLTYVAGDWNISVATGTNALDNTAGPGGWLRVTTGATSTNVQASELTPASFNSTSGASYSGQIWFWVGLNETSTNVPSWFLGLTAGGSSAPTDGLYFSRATASNNINFNLRKSGTSTVLSTVATSSASLNMALGFYYDGKPTPTLYVYASTPLTTPTAFGQPYYQGGVCVASTQTFTNFPIVLLSPSFALKTNATGAVTMDIDYLGAAQEQPTRF